MSGWFMSNGLFAGGLLPSDEAPRIDPESLLAFRRLAYTVLPPSLGRRRRARLADSLARNALALGDTRMTARAHLVREVLHDTRTGGWVPAPLARLGEASTPASRATEKALAAMVPAARAAFALLHLENLTPAQVTALLDISGVHDPSTVVSIAERTPLDPESMRALVVPAPTAAAPQRLVIGVSVGLVLAVAAPVVAVNAFGDDTKTPQPVSSSGRIGSEREAAVTAAKSALQDARDRAADADARAEAEESFRRILRHLNHSLDDRGLSRKTERRLRSLKAVILRERERFEG
jgi:hypothetical protein